MLASLSSVRGSRSKILGAFAMCAAIAVSSIAAPQALAANSQATDSFDRSVSTTWGTAPTGGPWTTSSGTGLQFSVQNSAGQITLDAGRAATATLTQVSLGDTRNTAVFSVADQVGSGLYFATESRRQASGDAYRLRARISSSGAIGLSAARVTGGAETTFAWADASASSAPNTDLVLKSEVTGTNPVVLRAKAWRSGSAEPGWQLTYSDAAANRISSSGAVGVWAYMSSSGARTTVRTSSFSSESATTSTSGTTTPAPATSTGSTSSRGAAPVGSASYSPPSGAVFVDGRSGDDRAAGTLGSPVRTVAAGVAKAASGGTVVIRAGSYNESVTVDKPLTLQAYPKEAVWFDGSIPITSWSASGSRWTASNWTPEFNSSMGSGDSYSRFVDSSKPLANRPDQVFLDGRNLTQVSSTSQVVAGTFYVDYGANTITIGDNPSGREVRASNRGQAILSTAAGVTLQGFGVRRYATPYLDSGAVRLGNARSTARDLVVQDNATIGLWMRNSGNLAERVTVTRNGMLGFGANQADGLVVRDSVVTGNNVERFKPAPVSGGIKITRSRTVSIKNSDVSGNLASGIWFDESCVGIVIAGNSTVSNTENNIELELSENAIVANNRVSGGKAGILIFDSGTVRVYNNEVGGNSVFGIQLSQDQRRQANASFDGHDPRQPIPDPTNPWLTRNIVIANNAFGNGGLFQVYGLDKKTNIPMDQMNVTINGNLFNRRVDRSNPTVVAWGGSDNVTLTRYETPEALAAAKNGAWRNKLTATSIPIGSMSSEIANAQSYAIAIPSDVASAMGVAAGTRMLGAL